MCKEMPIIPVNRVVYKKIIIGKNGGPRRRRGAWFIRSLTQKSG
jgi:GTPase Era involved in 16S rRNA processing